jgi:hypothetical protein
MTTRILHIKSWLAACLVLAAMLAASASASARDAPSREPCPRQLERRQPAGAQLDTSILVGRTVRRARSIAGRYGCVVRVVRRDGEALPITEDFSPRRINLSVVCGRVKRVVGVF